MSSFEPVFNWKAALILAICTDFVSLCIFGRHIVIETAALAVFVLVLAVIFILPKPYYKDFFKQSLEQLIVFFNKDGEKEEVKEKEEVEDNKEESNDELANSRETKQQEIKKKMMTCEAALVVPPKVPQQPKQGARAFFSDDIIGPNNSIPYDKKCPYSDYVGEGSYPNNREAFPTASGGTFDGIAIDSNTRVILWEKPNFQGKVLLDVIGPKIINNITHKSYYESGVNVDFKDAELEKNYPKNVRIWSETCMNSWTTGSVKIVAAP